MSGRSIRRLRSLLVSPTSTLALAAALAISIAYHFKHAGSVSVVAVTRTGTETEPTLLIDFDTEMADGAALDRPLAPGLVTLEPEHPVEARFLTTRRLAVTPQRALPRNAAFRIRLSPALAARDGRPVRPAVDRLCFDTGRLALAEKPQALLDADGAPVVRLRFT
jgi:hypothetical protein